MDRSREQKMEVKQKTIDKLHSWICDYPQVVNLLKKNVHVNLKYNRTG